MTTQTATTRQQPEVLPFKKRYITADEVSRLYGFSVSQLRQWRMANIGPPFRRFGYRKVLYSLSLLERWVEQQKGGGDAV